MTTAREFPGNAEFMEERQANLAALAQDADLRKQALALQEKAEAHKYGYQQLFCGVPIIRLPDDIHAFQEAVWSERPNFIVETGIARGGSLVMSAALMAMCGMSGRVLGLDILILSHARQAVENSPFHTSIQLWEGDSASEAAAAVVGDFVGDLRTAEPGFLVLDSDHTHSHVLAELELLSPLLPKGSLIFVADTLIEELPLNHYPDRNWGPGNNPMTAVTQFIQENKDFEAAPEWGRRALVTEFRDGVLRRQRVSSGQG